MKNEALANIAEGVKAKLDPNMQDAFERIVLAGMNFMYEDDKTSAMSLKSIQDAESVPVGVGEGVAVLIGLMFTKSRQKMPLEAGIPAGYALTCEGLDFCEQKGMVKIDNAAIDDAVGAYAQKVMNILKIDNAQVAKMKEQAQSIQDDPAIRQAYKEKYGQEPSMPEDVEEAMPEGGMAPPADPAAQPAPDMPAGGLVGPVPTQGVPV